MQSRSHNHNLRRLVGCALAVVAVGCLAVGGASAQGSKSSANPITVFAGSSMTQVLTALAPSNTYSFGSSTTLANQITAGAPADVFMSANTTAPQGLYNSGKLSKPIIFTRNTLTVVVPKANPANLNSVYDLLKPGVKIAEANSSVPVGSYTVQILKQMGINTQIQANVVTQETSDANVVAKVVAGTVDAGFVYTSDYVIDPTHLTQIKLPTWAQPKIQYSMGVVHNSSKQADAQAFEQLVMSPAGQALFVSYGFLPLTDTSPPVIQKFSPNKGAPGTAVTLTGVTLGRVVIVKFGNTPAKFKIKGPTTIVATVPRKAKSGKITAISPNGSSISRKGFRVLKHN